MCQFERNCFKNKNNLLVSISDLNWTRSELNINYWISDTLIYIDNLQKRK